jgi:hypothetical protein
MSDWRAGCGGRDVMWREGVKFLCVADVSGPQLPDSLLIVSGAPERPLWTEDRLRAPDTVLGRAGWNAALGRAAGNEKLSDGPKYL